MGFFNETQMGGFSARLFRLRVGRSTKALLFKAQSKTMRQETSNISLTNREPIPHQGRRTVQIRAAILRRNLGG
jgi:hypothetical protein